MKPNFLFGAEFALDPQGHYKYDSNYLTLEQLHEYPKKPEKVEVLDCRQKSHLGSIRTSLAFIKFSD
jgi:hypothetical protein